MRQVYFLSAIILLAISTSQAKTAIVFDSFSGNWSTASNWDLNRVPGNGDSVVIPAGKFVTLDKNENLSNMYIKVAGWLTVSKKLKLTGVSIVELTNTGYLWAGTNNRNTEIIEINGVNKFDQNAPFFITGAGFATSYSGVLSNGFGPNLVLPVVFNSFYAVKNNGNIILTWSTAQENNNKHFEIQRSVDGTHYNTIAVINGAGNSSLTQQYSYTDRNVTNVIVYYRIKQVDVNGQSELSVIKTIRSNNSQAVSKVYGSNKTINIEFNQEIKRPIAIRIFNQNGQLMAQQNIQNAAYRISLPFNYAQSGMYVVKISDGAEINEATKIIL